MKDNMDTPDRILAPIQDAARYIGRSRSFIYQAISDGTIAAVKSGARTLVKVESLRAYADSLPSAEIHMGKRRETA
jgi:excisionase family DNA binding protein